jgi:VWFA-related protein
MTTRRRTDSGLLCGALVLAALAVLGRASSPQPAAPQTPTFRTEANYVRVDVYPTKSDAPVADLTQADFEILENSVPQKIEQFERVVVRGTLPQEMRREPNSVEEARQAMQNPRARVIAIFLDVGHVDVAGSHNIRRPLVETLNRVIGEDDLVGVMTPEMSARDVTFARKTTTIEGFLTRHWPWGERDRLVLSDPVEDEYEACYGPRTANSITEQMIERRREKQTLDALEDLVVFLRGAREERKAILAITDGWRLYRPNPALADAGRADPPPIGVVPGTGRPAIGSRDPRTGIALADCERDRMSLAQIDDELTFRRLLDEANRGNASFYPLDPRGLPVFDAPIGGPGSAPSRPLSVDQAILTARVTTLRTLAEATDGLALVGSNDLSGSFKKLVDDLSSYYLLGYYSTGKLDGRFHPITVRVKRPGVRVRARRGYLAATPAATTAAAATAAAARAPAAADAELAAAASAVASLAPYAREAPLRITAAAGRKAGDSSPAALWVVGELAPEPSVDRASPGGATADVELLTSSGRSVATARATIPAGARSFRVGLAPAEPLAAGDYLVRVGVRGVSTAVPARDTVRLTLPSAPDAAGALWIRRGPTTGNREAPTADLRFRRTEQARVEIPTASSAPGTARLLDRTGRPLAVPVTEGLRTDADGWAWRTGQLALAALAPGDYIIELGEGERRTLAAFRVVP